MKKRTAKTLLKLFGISSAITFCMCFMIGIIGITAYNTMIYQGDTTVEVVTSEVITTEETDKPLEESEEVTNKELDSRINKTVAIFGIDLTDRLTDTILVANFNSYTNKVNVISVPRDTQVKWTEEQRALLPSGNKWVTVSKLNEMVSWGGAENVRGLTVNQLERILGIKIDNYIMVTLSAFRDIVDAIGGVWLDVPQRMYVEEVFGGLCIDLYAGYQELDGNKAEQFVRFRDYVNGDLGRIRAQQQFMEAFTDKVLSPQIITRIPAVIGTLFTSVKTDIKLSELSSYYPYLESLSDSEITFHMIPGADRRENGISYYFVDHDETDALVDEILYTYQ